LLDLIKGVKGFETNVWQTIEDESGKKHTGTLFVN
jgi:outer membrane lipoprotein-sorting protein